MLSAHTFIIGTLNFPKVPCVAAEMPKDSQHNYFCINLFLIWLSEHVWSKEEPGMKLCRLGRCVARNFLGLTRHTVEDMVQGVPSSTSTTERSTSLCWERSVFSPVWEQLLNRNQLSLASNCCLIWELASSCSGISNLICKLGCLYIALIFLSNLYVWFPFAFVLNLIIF